MFGRHDAGTPPGERLARRLASSHTRRGFLGRLGAAAVAATSGRLAASAVAPDTAEARYYGFCGHTYTTHHCPGPYFPPRIDRRGRPLRPKDGHRVDNLGRLVDRDGYVVDEQGDRVLGPTGDPVPRAPRTRLCQDWVLERYHLHAQFDGGWYRCCGGTIRKLVDCCAHTATRINGDAALTGYCYNGRKVFCVLYYQTTVPC
ncbi:MAG TPA: hypothetical protein VGC71_06890 [Gaiellales bacterium]